MMPTYVRFCESLMFVLDGGWKSMIGRGDWKFRKSRNLVRREKSLFTGGSWSFLENGWIHVCLHSPSCCEYCFFKLNVNYAQGWIFRNFFIMIGRETEIRYQSVNILWIVVHTHPPPVRAPPPHNAWVSTTPMQQPTAKTTNQDIENYILQNVFIKTIWLTCHLLASFFFVVIDSRNMTPTRVFAMMNDLFFS